MADSDYTYFAFRPGTLVPCGYGVDHFSACMDGFERIVASGDTETLYLDTEPLPADAPYAMSMCSKIEDMLPNPIGNRHAQSKEMDPS